MLLICKSRWFKLVTLSNIPKGKLVNSLFKDKSKAVSLVNLSYIPDGKGDNLFLDKSKED